METGDSTCVGSQNGAEQKEKKKLRHGKVVESRYMAGFKKPLQPSAKVTGKVNQHHRSKATEKSKSVTTTNSVNNTVSDAPFVRPFLSKRATASTTTNGASGFSTTVLTTNTSVMKNKISTPAPHCVEGAKSPFTIDVSAIKSLSHGNGNDSFESSSSKASCSDGSTSNSREGKIKKTENAKKATQVDLDLAYNTYLQWHYQAAMSEHMLQALEAQKHEIQRLCEVNLLLIKQEADLEKDVTEQGKEDDTRRYLKKQKPLVEATVNQLHNMEDKYHRLLRNMKIMSRHVTLGTDVAVSTGCDVDALAETVDHTLTLLDERIKRLGGVQEMKNTEELAKMMGQLADEMKGNTEDIIRCKEVLDGGKETWIQSLVSQAIMTNY